MTGFGDIAGAMALLDRGGVVLWVIAGLSVLTLAVILWKLARLARAGLWGGARAERAVAAWVAGDAAAARAALAGGRGLRARVVAAAIGARTDPALSADGARDEALRVARRALDEVRAGLRVLDLVATIAPLLGLLGTVLGMIAAFQALQEVGAQADPTVLAGGIWEALLTTAAGMAVAIPAGVALAWFESLHDRAQADLEDAMTRIFAHDAALKAGAGATAKEGAAAP
jgi:biopolymer transport protein ExbB